MKNSYLKIGIIGIFTIGIQIDGITQITENNDEDRISIVEEIFPSNPFDVEETITNRSSGGGTFDDDMTFEGNIPIDGGLSVVVTTLFGYGIKSIKKRRQLKKNVQNK
jgi:hypothetical protein